MRKINEIFSSLQGEGSHAGVPAVFVRFCGCNLQCPFCDTNHQQGRLMTDDEIFNSVAASNAPWVVLTGGEPSLFIDHEFVKQLKKRTGKRVAIETNGTNPVPSCIDWITVSPKTGMTPHDLPLHITHADELKVVDLGQPLEPYLSMPCVGSDTRLFLQPCYVDDETQFAINRKNTAQRVMSNPEWTISVQLHRYLDIR